MDKLYSAVYMTIVVMTLMGNRCPGECDHSLAIFIIAYTHYMLESPMCLLYIFK